MIVCEGWCVASSDCHWLRSCFDECIGCCIPFFNNLLCEFYISKNVTEKCKMLMTKAGDLETVIDAYCLGRLGEFYWWTNIWAIMEKLYKHVCM